MWKTIGHAITKDILSRQLKAEKLSHAYLFLGPEGCGKATLAREFAGKILQINDVRKHPDFSELSFAAGLSVEEVREYLAGLNSAPVSGKYKIVLLSDCEAMNTFSANALLKTLEEPRPSTLFLLTASKETFPLTIRSRCQVLHCTALQGEDLKAVAQSLGVDPSPELIRYSFGSAARIAALSQDKAALARAQQEETALANLSRASRAEKLLAATRYAEQETEDLSSMIDFWIELVKHKLDEHPKRVAVLKSLLDAHRKLSSAFNKKLVLERLFLELG